MEIKRSIMETLDERIRIVLGLDVGHGESAGCYVRVRNDDGTPVGQPHISHLNVNNSGDKKIFSTIDYTNSGVTIGGDCSSNLVAYFKRSPAEWDNTEPKTGKSYKTLMRDFIKKLTDCLLSPDYNPDEMSGCPRENIAIFVGCPSDSVWINDESRKEYEELIREATDIECVNVVAESTAAIFSTVGSANKNLKVNTSGGVAVFDFGSSTSDFTYIRLGKILAEKSWTLGASAIEKNIHEKVLLDEGIGTEHVFQGNLDAIYLKTRRDIKEAWYGDSINSGIKDESEGRDMAITYTPCDEFGTPQKRPNGSLISKSQDFYLCDEFMSSVEKKKTITGIKEKGVYVEPRQNSWYGYCEQFITECKNALIERGLPLEKIILTGGASRMGFIRELCDTIFDGGVEVVSDPSPSYCVCKGLCQIAINKMKIVPIVNEQIESTKNAAKDSLEIYREKVLDGLTDYIMSSYLEVLHSSAVTEGCTRIGDYGNMVMQYIGDNLTVSEVQKILEKPYEKLNESLKPSYTEVSRTAAIALYGNDESDYNCFIMDLDSYTKYIDIRGHINSELLKNAVNIVFYTIAAVLQVIACIPFAILGAAVGWIPFIGPKIEKWLDDLAEGVINTFPIFDVSTWKIKNKDHMDSTIRNRRDSVRGALRTTVDEVIKEQFGSDERGFYDIVEKNIDKLVRIVALEHFDERIQI